MEKEFVPYEQALALKELGFDEPCFMFYWSKHKDKLIKTSLMNHIGKDKNNSDLIFDSNNTALGLKDGIFCSAPLYQQAFRWFREKYNLLVSPKINEFHDRFYFTIRATEPRLMKEIILKREINYEEAELECLKKLIEIVKKK